MKNIVVKVWTSNIAEIHLVSMNRIMVEKKIESPIEQLLFLALTSADNIYKFSRDEYCSIDITPQYSIGKYRADFLVEGNKGKVIVECDSQAWHERDEAQRRYEKERDRFMQSKGYQTFHFTGKEIIEQPHLPALEIINAVTSMNLSESIKGLKDYEA